MATALSKHIGKAHITVDVEGCMYCGALWSSNWKVAKVVSFQLQGKTHQLPLYMCADCIPKHAAVLL